MGKVTKGDLIESIYLDLGFDKNDVQKITGYFLELVKKSLAQGNVVELRGFGTFEPRLRKGREKARNPKTGEIVSVQDHYVAAFRAGRELKNELLNLKDVEKID